MSLRIPQSVLDAYGVHNNSLVNALGAGNINDTFLVSTPTGEIVLQKINTHVFKTPDTIDQNIAVVSKFLQMNHQAYIFPHPLRTSEGATMVYDEAGVPWRALPYFAATTSHNVAPAPDYAYAAAYAFADFSRRLSELGTEILSPTILNFHNLTLREEEFANALRTTEVARLEVAKEVVAKYQAHDWIGKQYRELMSNKVYQERIFHHDTKLNNILFKSGTAEVVTIVDLDTIMPGYVYSDVGDLLMFGTSVFEDVTDLDTVVIDKEKWQAILTGYSDGIAGELTAEEQAMLPFSGLIMCYMLGLRFLTDYLKGEVYFKTQYEGQNLDKAKNRLKLLNEMVVLIER